MFNKKTISILLSAFMVIGTLGFSQSTVNADGVNGWQQVGSIWNYYINGSKAAGWILYEGKWYYLKSDGDMATGWITYNNKWYYLKSDGDMITGWLSYNGKWYYLKPNGDMATDWVLAGGKWYYLNPDGDLAVNTVTPDGYTVNANGAWITSIPQHIIYVNSVSTKNVNVAYGTAWKDVILPAKVTLNLSNGTSKDVAVTWRLDDFYNERRPGGYTITGDYKLPSGYKNGPNAYAISAVIVGESPDYANLISQVENKVSVFEGLANGDLSTQELVDAAKVAKSAIFFGTYTDGLINEISSSDYNAFVMRIIDADTKVKNAQSVIDAAKTYADLKATAEKNISAYETAAEDLSTQEKFDKVIAARAVIHVNVLTVEDQNIFQTRITAADNKVKNAETLLMQSHKLQYWLDLPYEF